MTFDFDGFRAIRSHPLQGKSCSCFYSAFEDCLPGPGAKKALEPKRGSSEAHPSERVWQLRPRSLSHVLGN